MNGLHEVEVLVFVVFAKRKPFKCTLCRFLLNIYGRKTPKYKKKVGLLTLYVGKSINLWRDWWIQINFWLYSNAKRWFKNVCAPENSECQSSEMSGHGLWILHFSVYHEVLSKSKICMLLVKTSTSFVLFNYRQHIFLFISVSIEKVELLVILRLFSFRKEETSHALWSVSVLQNTVEKTRNIKKSR